MSFQSPSPSKYRPRQLTLGKLELEIVQIIWKLGETTAKAINEVILADPDRELAYASVMTVLSRLEKKGWVSSRKEKRSIFWKTLVTAEEAQGLWAYAQLHSFLQMGDADMVAAFVDDLDVADQDKLAAIAHRLKELRQQREAGQ
jgi:predicted transcriptional regulator